MTIYDFTVKDNRDNPVSLEKYRGKVLLVVNTATKCGLTPQYEALERVYEDLREKGLEVLDFPCNQFLNQAPEDNQGIEEFCQLNYQTKFDRFSKIDVNGEKAEPLYKWLRKEAPVDRKNEASDGFEEKVKAYVSYESPTDIKWNFGKFLVDREGHVAARFSPSVTPEELKEELSRLLSA